MLLARRNLFKDRTRLALSVFGVALAVMLILLLNGFLTGMFHQVTSYLDNSPGSILVGQEGVANLLGATSTLPEGAAARAGEVQGVERVVPILSQFVILDLHQKKVPAYMVGYLPEEGGGPWAMAEGREPTADREVVVDRVLAGRHELTVGDSIDILGEPFTITGLSEETASWMTGFFFVHRTAAEGLFKSPGATSYLLIGLAPGASGEAIRARLAEQPGVDAFWKTDAAANDLKLYARFFSAPARLMVGIAFWIGSLVVGLVIYTATIERQREYGVLKAVGAGNATLYAVVVIQAVIAALAGVALGVLLAYGLAQWIMAVRPQFLILLESDDILRALIFGLAMAMAAALLPAQLVARLAPAEVFRR